MGGIVVDVGAPGTVGSAGGQRIYSYNAISTVPQQVVGLNPQRQSITFHNPGTVDIFVAPASVQNGGSDTPLTPSPTALGGCFRVFANGGTLKVSGECQKPWQAFAGTGTTNPLTVMDSNVPS